MTFGYWIAAGAAFACALTSTSVQAAPKTFSGIASFYGKDYHGRTARGETYDPGKFTAAHRSLPFGTRVRVTDVRSRQTVTVVINDRGPFVKGRVLDLSMAAAKALHMTGRGVTRVLASVE